MANSITYGFERSRTGYLATYYFFIFIVVWNKLNVVANNFFECLLDWI